MKNANVCRYCGQEASGYGCLYSPTGLHVKIGDETKCIFCGGSSYGTGCAYNNGRIIRDYPARLHVHGHGKKLCIFCGSSSAGKGCPYSPDGKHRF